MICVDMEEANMKRKGKIFLLIFAGFFILVLSSQYVSAWDYCEERDNGVIIWTGWFCFEPGSSLCAGITYKDVCSNGDITEYNFNANNDGYIINRVDCGNNFCATIIPPGDVMCVECLTDNSCPSGERCVNRECVSPLICNDPDNTDGYQGRITRGRVTITRGSETIFNSNYDSCSGSNVIENKCTSGTGGEHYTQTVSSP